MKKSKDMLPVAQITISGELWVDINRVARYMKTTPEYWINDRLRGQLSRFSHKGGIV
jgi:hypothetical protein